MKNLTEKQERLVSYRICLLLLLFLFFSLITTRANAQSNGYNVLFLNSYNLGYAWSDSITKGVKKALNQKDVKLFLECLDAKRFGQEKFDVFSKYIALKYAGMEIDVVIASDNDALDFVFRYGNKLFPKVPVVFCGINNPEDYNFRGRQMHGFIESTDPNKSVALMSHLIPDAKSLLFVTDNTTSGIIIKKEYERLQKLYPFIKINFISDIDVDELIKTVQKGDKGDIVYLMRINRDKYGKLVDYLDFFRKIAEASPRPVFADDEAIMGYGVVGGNANRGSTQGYHSGLLALKILRNHSLKDIPQINKVDDEYIFDYKQLKKYNINNQRLPENSVVINKPTKYLKYIVILLTVVIILTSIVIVLTLINRRRIRAERKVKEQLLLIEQSYTQLSDMNCELEEANAQLLNLNISLEDAKKKAEESEKLKSSFLANLSHEIRTPLNAILGFSSLLVEPSSKMRDKEKYFNIIQSNSNSLLVLIDDILDFSKIDAGQVHIHKEPVMIKEIFDELYAFFRDKGESKVQLLISENALNNNVILDTDKTRFKQILTNLLTNAFKFTEKGFIEMGFEVVNQDYIKFYVRDTGIGIDKAHHETIFERFRKIENDKTKLYSGSGLGLAICKKLTELMGGRIWVEGGPGAGSVFCFTHPGYSIFSNGIREKKNGSIPNISYNWNGHRIAIAEDEDTNFLLLEHVLSQYGAELIWFKDGISIVEHFTNMDKNDISLILMDLKMPGMDGYKAQEMIKKLYPSMIIIAQSAYALNEDIARIRQRGFDDFITKPINMDILKEKLDKYLS